MLGNKKIMKVAAPVMAMLLLLTITIASIFGRGQVAHAADPPSQFYTFNLKSLNATNGDSPISGAQYKIQEKGGTSVTTSASTYAFPTKEAEYIITVDNKAGNPANDAQVVVTFGKDDYGNPNVKVVSSNTLTSDAEIKDNNITFKARTSEDSKNFYRYYLSSVNKDTGNEIKDATFNVVNDKTGETRLVKPGWYNFEDETGSYTITANNGIGSPKTDATVKVTFTKTGSAANVKLESSSTEYVYASASDKAITFRASKNADVNDFYIYTLESVNKADGTAIPTAKFTVEEVNGQKNTGILPGTYKFDNDTATYKIKVDNGTGVANNAEATLTFTKDTKGNVKVTGATSNSDQLLVNTSSKKITFMAVDESQKDAFYKYTMDSVYNDNQARINGAQIIVKDERSGTESKVSAGSVYTFPAVEGSYKISVDNGAGAPVNNSFVRFVFAKDKNGKMNLTTESVYKDGVLVSTADKKVTFQTPRDAKKADFYTYTLKSINSASGQEITGANFIIYEDGKLLRNSPEKEITFKAGSNYLVKVDNGQAGPTNNAIASLEFKIQNDGSAAVESGTSNSQLVDIDLDKKEIVFKANVTTVVQNPMYTWTLRSEDKDTGVGVVGCVFIITNTGTGQREVIATNDGKLPYTFPSAGTYEITITNPSKYSSNASKATVTITDTGVVATADVKAVGESTQNTIDANKNNRTITFKSTEASKMDDFYEFKLTSIDKKSGVTIPNPVFTIVDENGGSTTVNGNAQGAATYKFPNAVGNYTVTVKNPVEYADNDTKVNVRFYRTNNEMRADLTTAGGTDENDANINNGVKAIEFRSTKVTESASNASYTFDLASVDRKDANQIIEGATFTISRNGKVLKTVKYQNGQAKYTFPQESGSYVITVTNPSEYSKNETKVNVTFRQTGNVMDVTFDPVDQTISNYVSFSQDKKKITFHTIKTADIVVNDNYTFDLSSVDANATGTPIEGATFTVSKDGIFDEVVNQVDGHAEYTFEPNRRYYITVNNPSDYSVNRSKVTLEITKDAEGNMKANISADNMTDENAVEFANSGKRIIFTTTKADQSQDKDFYTFKFSSTDKNTGELVPNAKFVITETTTGARANPEIIEAPTGEITYEFKNVNGSYTVEVVNTDPAGKTYATNKSKVLLKFTSDKDGADVTIDGEGLTENNNVKFGKDTKDIIFRTSEKIATVTPDYFTYTFESKDKTDNTNIAAAKFSIKDTSGNVIQEVNGSPGTYTFPNQEGTYVITVDNGTTYRPNATKVTITVSKNANGDPKISIHGSSNEGVTLDPVNRKIIYKSDKNTGSVALDPPKYVGFNNGKANNVDDSGVERLFATSFDDYVNANSVVDRINNSDIVYCFNATRKYPKSYVNGQYDDGGRYKSDTFEAYDKHVNPSADFFTDMASNKKTGDTITDPKTLEKVPYVYAEPRLKGEELKQKIISIGLNGYPHDYSKFQGSMSADDFRIATQYAIWYYTDPDIYESYVNGKQLPTSPPQNLGESDAAYRERIKKKLTQAQRNMINRLINSDLSKDVTDAVGTTFAFYEHKGGLAYYTNAQGEKIWYNNDGANVYEAQHLLSVGPEKLTKLPVTINLTAKKTVDGGTPDTNDYWFDLIDSNGNIIETVNNNGQDVIFQKLSFAKAGTYTFFINERRGDRTDISYDESKQMVKVVVTENTNNLTATTSYSRVGAANSRNSVYYGFQETGRTGGVGTYNGVTIAALRTAPKELIDKYTNGLGRSTPYLTNAQMQEIVNLSQIAYCYNLDKIYPPFLNGDSVSANTDNLVNKLHLYDNKETFTPDNFGRLVTSGKSDYDAAALKRKIVSVILNGYPNDLSNKKGSLTDDQFRLVTQLAVWRFTNKFNADRTKMTSAMYEVYEYLVNTEVDPKLIAAADFANLVERDNEECAAYQNLVVAGMPSTRSGNGEADIAFENLTDETEEEPVKHNIPAKKTLTNGDLKDYQFTFKLTDKVTGVEVGKTKNDANGNINFELVYTPDEKGKTFTYTLVEEKTIDGVVYDTATYEITVEVTTAGKASTTKIEKISADTTRQTVNDITFTNTIDNTPPQRRLTIKKETTGTYNDPDRVFTFNLALEDKNGKPISGTYSGVEFAIDGTARIELKSNETKIIEGLPDGYSYWISEKNASDYILKVNDQVIDSKSVNGTDVTEDKAITFVNHKDLEYSLKVVKDNDDRELLAGALFKVYKDADCRQLAEVYTDPNKTNLIGNANDQALSTNDRGELYFYGLTQGTYYLKEVEAPLGYTELVDPVPIEVSQNGKVFITVGNTKVDKTPQNGSTEISVKVTNDKLVLDLPTTGYSGVLMGTIISIAGMISAFVIWTITTNRKKQEQ